MKDFDHLYHATYRIGMLTVSILLIVSCRKDISLTMNICKMAAMMLTIFPNAYVITNPMLSITVKNIPSSVVIHHNFTITEPREWRPSCSVASEADGSLLFHNSIAAKYGLQKLMMGIKKLTITILGADFNSIPSVLRFLYPGEVHLL